MARHAPCGALHMVIGTCVTVCPGVMLESYPGRHVQLMILLGVYTPFAHCSILIGKQRF